MTAFRDDFVVRFGETNALHIEWAADSHKNGVHDKPGSDPFRWAILICIGWQCLEKFAEYHEITCAWEDVRDWLKTHKDYISAHDGDVDYLAVFTGVYDEFVEDSE